jgi:PilZ domain
VKTISPQDKIKGKTLDPNDRRQGKRVVIAFPIEISGFDSAGRIFRERSVTSDVSEQGCKFDLLRELKGGDVIAIQLVSPGKDRPEKSPPLLFEVAWVCPSTHGWAVGASKLQPENIWHLIFPPKKSTVT